MQTKTIKVETTKLEKERNLQPKEKVEIEE